MKMDTKRSRINRIVVDLKHDRLTHESTWKDITRLIHTKSSRFNIDGSDSNNSTKKDIIDSTGTFASRTLRSGMMTGITSPARPWFKLSHPDPKFKEYPEVEKWLSDSTNVLRSILIKSNFYKAVQNVFGDIGSYATGAVYMEKDPKSTVRFYPFPIGSYWISNNSKLIVDTFYREFTFTVRQVVERFAFDNTTGEIDWSVVSQKIKDLWETGKREEKVYIGHIIMPNEDYDPNKIESQYKEYVSHYFELGRNAGSAGDYLDINEKDKFLRTKGYDYFPVFVPRWETTGEDAWGTESPGMVALGDVKQLQHGEKKSLKGIDKGIDPPMIADASMRGTRTSILPGDITYEDSNTKGAGFRAAHQLHFDLNALEGKQEQVRARIKRAYYEDLFLMLTTSTRRNFTATEIDERHEEKLLALGPVLEQLNQDLLDPLIEGLFIEALEAGKIPPPPEILQGEDLKVEYVSIMAQAQKLAGIGNIERFLGFFSQLLSLDPSISHRVDLHQVLKDYGESLTIPPGMIRSDEELEDLKAAEEQALQAQQDQENLKNMTGAMKDLSQTDLKEDSALKLLAGA